MVYYVTLAKLKVSQDLDETRLSQDIIKLFDTSIDIICIYNLFHVKLILLCFVNHNSLNRLESFKQQHFHGLGCTLERIGLL